MKSIRGKKGSRVRDRKGRGENERQGEGIRRESEKTGRDSEKGGGRVKRKQNSVSMVTTSPRVPVCSQDSPVSMIGLFVVQSSSPVPVARWVGPISPKGSGHSEELKPSCLERKEHMDCDDGQMVHESISPFHSDENSDILVTKSVSEGNVVVQPEPKE
ncbi:uncharacterized protein ACOB8E_005721 isoform 1-T1 [Sarcophilus harrisii]